ncbi:MAG: class II fructose-bisphosphate aldolase [Clostridiales bacterium]|nr:class II fructose-bisphosphate aldolase [Clostridiales bacterium]
MPIVTTGQMLRDAQKGGYAVGAFNTDNMEILQAVIAAAVKLHSPVILQANPVIVEYAGLDYFFAMAKTAAKSADVPVAIHLDHGNSFDLVMKALRTGYTSIMFDGSHMDIHENIRITKSIVDACIPAGIPVEAEIGKVGGKEDKIDAGEGEYTDVDEAADFADKTGVSSLAVAIGTAHGVYKGIPKLNYELLSRLRNALSIPLVLHGASGLPDEALTECIRRGICKINFATELRMAYTEGLKEFFAEKPESFDAKEYGRHAREKVMLKVMERIRICGSEGRA